MSTYVDVDNLEPRGRAPWRLVGRMAWIVVRLLLALLLMQRGSTFFYQGF